MPAKLVSLKINRLAKTQKGTIFSVLESVSSKHKFRINLYKRETVRRTELKNNKINRMIVHISEGVILR